MRSRKSLQPDDNLFDIKMVIKGLDGGKLPSWYRLEDDVLMTTWHHDFDEGFWFVTCVAAYEDMPIDTVVVANLTKGEYLPIIQNLVKKLNKGWLPPD